MTNLDLVRFLCESAGELIGKAEHAGPGMADAILDEAEELLALGAAVFGRDGDVSVGVKEAA